MAKESAGLLMYRFRDNTLEVLLAHPGGPVWMHKDAGAWSIPKGEILPGEAALDAAKREFFEETGIRPQGTFLELRPVRLKSGKLIRAWAFESDCDPKLCTSNSFKMEWPPKSGKFEEYPEADRFEFSTPDEAREKLNPGQIPLVQELKELVSPGGKGAAGA